MHGGTAGTRPFQGQGGHMITSVDGVLIRSSRPSVGRYGLALVASVALALAASGARAAELKAGSPGPKADAAWMARLRERGQAKVYRGDELETIGMPCGGVAAGQLYVRGDGTLAQWWIFNNATNTGYGDKCYRTYRPESPLEQGFLIRVEPGWRRGGRAAAEPRRFRRHRVRRRVPHRPGPLSHQRQARPAGRGRPGGLQPVHPAQCPRLGPAGHGHAVQRP